MKCWLLTVVELLSGERLDCRNRDENILSDF